MLGLACFRLPFCRSTTAAISYRLHCFSSIPCAASASAAAAANDLILLNVKRRSDDVSQLKKSNHSSCCLRLRGASASIWHALLPSASASASALLPIASQLSKHNKSALCAASTLSEGSGSWNASWDARPARWLHGSHSAWLLFGICTCFSYANADAFPNFGDNLDSESESGETVVSGEETQTQTHTHPGKKVYTDYSVTAIPADGRCLFRAVAHGCCLRSGKPAPSEKEQRELADKLRAKVAEEFVKRRKETEWFLEGSFDSYVEQIKKPHVWGGEPELLMASHVLKMPITVYMQERSADGLIAIAEYGQEYGKGKPICLLYDGHGHYEALEIRDI